MVNEINRILKLFANLQYGECWIGKNFKEVPHGAGAELAIKKISAETNSTGSW